MRGGVHGDRAAALRPRSGATPYASPTRPRDASHARYTLTQRKVTRSRRRRAPAGSAGVWATGSPAAPRAMLTPRGPSRRVAERSRDGSAGAHRVDAVNLSLTIPMALGIASSIAGGTDGTHVGAPHSATRLRDLARPWPEPTARRTSTGSRPEREVLSLLGPRSRVGRERAPNRHKRARAGSGTVGGSASRQTSPRSGRNPETGQSIGRRKRAVQDHAMDSSDNVRAEWCMAKCLVIDVRVRHAHGRFAGARSDARYGSAGSNDTARRSRPSATHKRAVDCSDPRPLEHLASRPDAALTALRREAALRRRRSPSPRCRAGRPCG